MRGILTIVTVGALVAVGCAVSQLTPVTFSLSYEFKGSAVDIFPAPACARYSALEIRDARVDQDVVGERTIQERPGRWEISASGDAESWLRRSAETVFGHARITSAPDAAGRILLELRSIRMEESAHRNAVFSGQVVVGAAVTGEAGGSAWDGRGEGTARNYGRPGNPANYQETVNHALDRAMIELANEERLHRALCGGSAS